MIDLREAKKEDLELLYSMQLKAFAALYEKYQDKETSPLRNHLSERFSGFLIRT